MLTTMARLLDAFALRPGQPDSGLPHPAAQRLSRHAHIMALAQLLGGQRRTKVRVVLPDQPAYSTSLASLIGDPPAKDE